MDPLIVRGFIFYAVLPALSLALFVIFYQKMWRCFVFLFCIVKKWIKKNPQKTKLILAFFLIFLEGNFINNTLHISDYFRAQFSYSTLYEKHYHSFNFSNLEIQQNTPRNLIVILVESLEVALSEKSIYGESKKYAPFGETIPYLSQLAKKHINFSGTNVLGGAQQLYGTTWTIAGTISQLCGIPLNIPIGGNEFKNKNFLNHAVCVPDVLNQLGYEQDFLSGANLDFAGTEYFLNKHKIKVQDKKFLIQTKKVPNQLDDFKGLWGIKDGAILNIASDILKEKEKSKKPFALYISTVDTHFGKGFMDPKLCANIENTYAKSFTCADFLIGQFIEKFQKSPLAQNTTIVILGDHLTMGEFFPKETNRRVFNLFINPRFTYTEKDLKVRTQFRDFSHFDIAPLLLDSIGIPTESFGLGRNPLYKRTLLETDFNEETFNKELMLPNKMYESFWNN